MFDPLNIAREFTSSTENFHKRGSGSLMYLVADFYITLAPYRPTQGSSYIPTPPEIRKKAAILNVNNLDDNLCFLWSILAGIHPIDRKQDPNRLCHYKPYLNKLNTMGLSFQLKVRDVPKFQIREPKLGNCYKYFGSPG